MTGGTYGIANARKHVLALKGSYGKDWYFWSRMRKSGPVVIKYYCFTRIQHFQEMVGYLHMKLDIALEEDI